MSAALEHLDWRLPHNPGVASWIPLDPRRNPIIVSPLEAKPEPPDLGPHSAIAR